MNKLTKLNISKIVRSNILTRNFSISKIYLSDKNNENESNTLIQKYINNPNFIDNKSELENLNQLCKNNPNLIVNFIKDLKTRNEKETKILRLYLTFVISAYISSILTLIFGNLYYG